MRPDQISLKYAYLQLTDKYYAAFYTNLSGVHSRHFGISPIQKCLAQKFSLLLLYTRQCLLLNHIRTTHDIQTPLVVKDHEMQLKAHENSY